MTSAGTACTSWLLFAGIRGCHSVCHPGWRRYPHEGLLLLGQGGEVLVHELDCDCGFADRGCHSLDRSMTGVTGYEDPGLARLEWVGITLKRPPAISVTTGQDVGAGDHESVLVATEPSFDSLGHGNAADHDEQRICGQLDLLTRRLVGDHESFESSVASCAGDP